MQYIKKFSKFKMINELFVHNDDDNYEDKKFILYKKDLWVFDYEYWEENELWVEINDVIGEDILEQDLDDSIRTILEEYSYILAGEIIENKIVLDGTMNFRHSSISDDLKKLKKELNLPIKINHYTDTYAGDVDDFELDTEEFKNAYFYHGTSLKYLEQIYKEGLKPMINNTNFDKIKHKDKIFITSNLEKALFHAQTTAMKTDSFPIILKLKIPDHSKLVLDYDLALGFYGTNAKINKELGYDNVYRNSGGGAFQYDKPILDNDKDIDISKKLGIYGYVGRIPSSFIEDVFIDLNVLRKYPELLDEDYYSDMSLKDYDSEIWQEFDNVKLWSELSIKDTLNTINNILYDFNSEIEEEY